MNPSPMLTSLFGLIGTLGTVAGLTTVSFTTDLPWCLSVCSNLVSTTVLNRAATAFAIRAASSGSGSVT